MTMHKTHKMHAAQSMRTKRLSTRSAVLTAAVTLLVGAALTLGGPGASHAQAGMPTAPSDPATANKSAPTPETTQATDAATKAVTTWLGLTDGGKYGESWDAASQSFRGALTRENWTTALTQVRTPLGAPATRVLKSVQLTSNPPNLPPGEYVVIQFDTAFDKRPNAVETLLAGKDSDQSWRVSAYMIK